MLALKTSVATVAALCFLASYPSLAQTDTSSRPTTDTSSRPRPPTTRGAPGQMWPRDYRFCLLQRVPIGWFGAGVVAP